MEKTPHEVEMEDIRNRLATVESKIQENTELTEEIRNILHMAKRGLSVIGTLGTAAIWMGKIASALVALYVFWYTLTHFGKPPNV